MGTAATPTKVHMSDAFGGMFQGIFTLALDTTDANGLQTIDFTDYFDYIEAGWIAGELVATKTGYIPKLYVPGATTAVSSTNTVLGIYESAGDGDEMDPLASTDVSAVITGLTVVIIGKQAV